MNAFRLIWIITAGVFGLMFGSFLNVVIYRLPRRESLVYPASHCPGCGGAVKWYDNIPVFSYILLRGKCRTCKNPISPFYPLVELSIAFIAMWLFYLHGGTLDFASNFILACILLAAAFIDMKYMIIPDRLNVPGAVIGVIFALLSGFKAVVIGVVGAFTGIAILMVLFWMGKIFFHREGVGMGDVKLAAVIGIFVGPFWCAIALLLAVFSGGVWGIIQMLFGKKTVQGQIPFGPFISLGGGAVLLCRSQIISVIELYLSLL